MSFFDEFNQIVPYFVKVTIGKNKQLKTDTTKKSYSNHKGKMVAFYKKSKTLEDLEKYGVGEHVEYLPVEQVSMPIDIQVTSDENLMPIFEETSKYTDKKRTSHTIRIFNSNKAQVGYVSISLTPAGDIDRKTCFYESPNGAERIRHTIYNKIDDGNVTKEATFEFKKNSDEGTKKVEISQRNGKVVGCSVLEQELETRENVAFQSITDFTTDEKNPKIKRYVASCVVDETDHSKRGGSLIPWECMTLEEDLFEYQKNMEQFQQHVERFKTQTGIDVSIEKAVELGKLSYDEQKALGISPTEFNTWYYCRLARYLSDERNNILKNFKGNYIGNILKLTDKGYEACIVTKHQKDGQDYRIYTLIDLRGTSISKGTGLDAIVELVDRDQNYLNRLKNADKTPAFVTTIGKDGNEQLVLYRGTAITGECKEYEKFVEDFIAPLSEIEHIQMNRFLNKKSKEER